MIRKLKYLQYYEHVPEKAINGNGATFVWNEPDSTGRTVLTNQTDIVLHHKKERRLACCSIYPYQMILTLTQRN
jgi:hypothetical protein